jgi:hypothetical protein
MKRSEHHHAIARLRTRFSPRARLFDGLGGLNGS